MSELSEQISVPFKVMEWIGDAESGYLRLLDQTALPGELTFLDCRDPQTLRSAIRRLVVRGAPAIGVAGGYGMVLAAQSIPDGEDFLSALTEAGECLGNSRPTAVNLSWAVRRVLDVGRRGGDIREEILREARAIDDEDVKLCLGIGKYAAPLIRKNQGVLTHCNAGALATAGIGTATAGMYVAAAEGHRFTVYCDETRPLLQGSRLTAWELNQAGIEAVVITDSMAGQVLKENRVGMVITGADRIAANGDAANKIGTYPLAVLSKHHGVPFHVAAPYSTFDLSLKTGREIPIEQRASEEITEGFGRRTAPEGIATYSPAFDVTPAELITSIITDRGIISPVNEKNVRKLIG